MTDDRTPALGLQLPHPQNLLEQDVLRLRAAFASVDSACDTLAALIEGRVTDAELAAAVAALQGSISNLNTTVTFLTASKVGVVNGLAWTEVGGELLEVEAGVMDGSGKLELIRFTSLMILDMSMPTRVSPKKSTGRQMILAKSS